MVSLLASFLLSSKTAFELPLATVQAHLPELQKLVDKPLTIDLDLKNEFLLVKLKIFDRETAKATIGEALGARWREREKTWLLEVDPLADQKDDKDALGTFKWRMDNLMEYKYSGNRTNNLPSLSARTKLSKALIPLIGERKLALLQPGTKAVFSTAPNPYQEKIGADALRLVSNHLLSNPLELFRRATKPFVSEDLGQVVVNVEAIDLSGLQMEVCAVSKDGSEIVCFDSMLTPKDRQAWTIEIPEVSVEFSQKARALIERSVTLNNALVHQEPFPIEPLIPTSEAIDAWATKLKSGVVACLPDSSVPWSYRTSGMSLKEILASSGCLATFSDGVLIFRPGHRRFSRLSRLDRNILFEFLRELKKSEHPTFDKAARYALKQKPFVGLNQVEESILRSARWDPNYWHPFLLLRRGDSQRQFARFIATLTPPQANSLALGGTIRGSSLTTAQWSELKKAIFWTARARVRIISNKIKLREPALIFGAWPESQWTLSRIVVKHEAGFAAGTGSAKRGHSAEELAMLLAQQEAGTWGPELGYLPVATSRFVPGTTEEVIYRLAPTDGVYIDMRFENWNYDLSREAVKLGDLPGEFQEVFQKSYKKAKGTGSHLD